MCAERKSAWGIHKYTTRTRNPFFPYVKKAGGASREPFFSLPHMPQLPILPTHVTLSIFHRYEVWAGDRLNQVLNERFLENKDKLDVKYRSILGEHYDNFFSSADKSGSA